MVKKMMLLLLITAFSVLISCDNAYESGSLNSQITDESAADSAVALETFDDAFSPSAEEFSLLFFELLNINSLEDLIEQGNVTLDNPVANAIIQIGLSNASAESIQALLTVIKNGVLNPWSLLDPIVLNGTFGCVSWSTGADFDLQITQAIEDFFNGTWWTFTVQVSLDECSEVSGDLQVDISGSRLGVVYTVHVTGDLTVASMPDKTFDLDILYDLEEALGSWDAVDWSGTINGYEISDLY